MRKITGQLKLYTGFCGLMVILFDILPFLGISNWVNLYDNPIVIISLNAVLALVWLINYFWFTPKLIVARKGMYGTEKGNLVTLPKEGGKKLYVVVKVILGNSVRLQGSDGHRFNIPIRETRLISSHPKDFLIANKIPIIANFQRGDDDVTQQENVIILYHLALEAWNKLFGSTTKN